MKLAEIEEQVKAARWYHAFEVVPGVRTPGISAFDAPATLDFLGVPRELGGKRALDVGTWDGPLAFEMEGRGAQVEALDVQDPDCTAFNTAKAVRGSRVRYTQGSVYDLQRLFSGKFDLITYFGVYYHLKNPIGAFEALSRSLADGGTLCFEGEVLAHYSETLAGTPSNLDNRLLANSDVPLALCYPGLYKGASNWLVPNLACLRGWLLAAGFDLTYYSLNLIESARPHPSQRILAAAKKASDLPVIEETPIFKKNLELPEGWFEQYQGMKTRKVALGPAAAAQPHQRKRIYSRLLRGIRRRIARG
jgi:tRNA (mo5U34)-methyltransferase